MRGLGEEIKETMVVQKILRSLPSIFNPKISVVEERDTQDQIKLDELHGILTAYEMRVEDSKPKEAAFKVEMKNQRNRKGQLSCDLEDVSDEEMANFVNRLPRGTGGYKGKPL